jgi:hypothetical protein
MAAEPGFEPGLKDPKSSVLPLHNSAISGQQLPSSHMRGAEGRTRTDTEVSPQQFLRLPRLPFRHFGLESTLLTQLWCRGGDLNSHRLSPTTPSRWRVYQFHHLGKIAGVAGFEPVTGGFGVR